jgi:hypothetical protein
MGTGGIHKNFVLKPCLPHNMLKYCISRRRTTNITHANKEDTDFSILTNSHKGFLIYVPTKINYTIFHITLITRHSQGKIDPCISLGLTAINHQKPCCVLPYFMPHDFLVIKM